MCMTYWLHAIEQVADVGSREVYLWQEREDPGKNMVTRSRNDLSHIFMAHQNGESFTMRNKGQTEITGDMETEKKRYVHHSYLGSNQLDLYAGASELMLRMGVILVLEFFLSRMTRLALSNRLALASTCLNTPLSSLRVEET